jgi:hypothetical protein
MHRTPRIARNAKNSALESNSMEDSEANMCVAFPSFRMFSESQLTIWVESVPIVHDTCHAELGSFLKMNPLENHFIKIPPSMSMEDSVTGIGNMCVAFSRNLMFDLGGVRAYQSRHLSCGRLQKF